MTNQSGLMKYKNHLITLLFILLAVLLGMFIASERLETYETAARVQVAEQEAVLTTIAETIARNGADAVTESIVRDCPVDERIRFDALLGQLDGGLVLSELRELDQMFSSCASFFADRKALMATRFSRETEVYAERVKLLDTLTTSDQYADKKVEQWKELAAEEQKQSELFADLVRAQKAIIDALIAGNSAQSEEIVTILTDVREIREALIFSRQQASALRGGLTTL